MTEPDELSNEEGNGGWLARLMKAIGIIVLVVIAGHLIALDLVLQGKNLPTNQVREIYFSNP